MTDTKATAGSSEATPTTLDAKCTGGGSTNSDTNGPSETEDESDESDEGDETDEHDETDESKGQMTNAPTMHGIVVCLIIVCFVNFI